VKGFTSKAIHARSLKKDAHGALRMPVYDAVSFEFENSEQIQAAFQGRLPAHSYSRISNPTIEDFENRLKATAGAQGALALSSGMAAITNVLLALCSQGDRIIASKHLFGNTYSLFDTTLRRYGIDTTFVDFNHPEQLEAALDDSVRAVFLETITNPQIYVPDIKKISAIVNQSKAALIIDNTLTTPYLLPVKRWGGHIEVLSTTKFISGGATVVGGAILDYGTYDYKQNPNLATQAKRFGPFALMATLRSEIYRNLGSCTTPHNAWLMSLGLETLALRVDKSCANALAIAQALQHHPKIQKVHYPGLVTDPFHSLAQQLMPKGCGGLLSFELATKQQAFALMDSFSLIRRSTNLNDNKTLVLHPASTIYGEFSIQSREHMAVGEGLIRLSAGIEDTQDILNDLQQGLDTL